MTGPVDIHQEIEFFDRFEAEHGHYDVLGEAAYRRLVGIFVDRVRPRPGERCVDLGCGTGAFTRRLRGLGLELSGMDVSPASIDRANRDAEPGETYRVADIRNTTLAPASMDIVVYSGVLHHTYQEITPVLAEGYRILRAGGRLFAFDPSVHSPSMFLYRDPRSPLSTQKGKTANEHLLHRDRLREHLGGAGFADVDVRGVSGITYRYIEGALASRLLPLYNLYEEALRRSPLERWFGTFVVSVAVKR